MRGRKRKRQEEREKEIEEKEIVRGMYKELLATFSIDRREI